MGRVEDILDGLGPCLSTKLAEELVKEGLSREAARKQVSRAGGSVKRLAHLTFPHSARFVYLKHQFNSESYWAGLKDAVVTHSPAYGPALAALIMRGGIVPKAHFNIVCGAPIKQKKHLASDAIYSRFLAAGLTKEIEVHGVGVCIVTADLANSPQAAIASLKARLIVEEILLKALKTWLRNLGIASFHLIATRHDGAMPPRVGTFAWDLTGPSYLAAITQWTKAQKLKSGFVACDVLLGHVASDAGIQAFIKKCVTLRSLKNVGRCIQIFVAERYSAEAFASARKAGVIPATPASLFGKDVADGLTQLAQVLTTAATASMKPEIFDELFKKLGAIEGAAMNLRGALFEFIVAELIRLDGELNVTLNTILRDLTSGKSVEVDVLSHRSHKHVLFIECKGFHADKSVVHAEVENWLTNRVPFLNELATQHPDWKNVERRFEFWTSGTFSPQTIAMLQKASSKTKKYKIGFKDAKGIKDYVATFQGSPFLKTLNEHFFRHPLANVEEK